MKKITNILTAVVAVALLGSCSGSESPEKVTEKYLNFLKEKKYDKAKELGTESTKQMLDAIAMFAGAMPESTESKSKVENIKCKEEGDRATCTYCCNDQGNEDKVTLVKQDGKWLVDMKKETPAMDATDTTGAAMDIDTTAATVTQTPATTEPAKK